MAVLFGVYSRLAPGVGESSGVAILAAFAITQVFAALKVALRVAFLASELALFEVTS